MLIYPLILFHSYFFFSVFFFIFILPYKISLFKLRPPLVNTIILVIVVLVYFYFSVYLESSPFRIFFSDTSYFGNSLSAKNILGTFFSFDAHHLVGNLVFLYVFGNLIASEVSYKFYLLLLIFSTAIIAQVDTGMGVYSIGISGFVTSLLGASVILFPARKIKFFYSLIIISGTFKLRLIWLVLAVMLDDIFGLLNFLLGFSVSNTNYIAHLTGFGIGMIMAHIAYRDKYIKPKTVEVRMLDFLTKRRKVVLVTKFNSDNRHIMFVLIAVISVHLVLGVAEAIHYIYIFGAFEGVGILYLLLYRWPVVLVPLFIVSVFKLSQTREINPLRLFTFFIMLMILINLFLNKGLENGVEQVLIVMLYLQAIDSKEVSPSLLAVVRSLKAIRAAEKV